MVIKLVKMAHGTFFLLPWWGAKKWKDTPGREG
jgi:hypothetical protein